MTLEENKKFIIDLYTIDHKNIRQIATLLKTGIYSVTNLLRKENIKLRTARNSYNRKYSVDHNYFNRIDSHNKAYCLGILYSDGSVGYTNNTINLVSKDVDLLNFFKKEIKFTGELKPNCKAKHCLNITFASEIMKRDLIKLGCVPRKSLILDFPNKTQVPEEFIWSFILGYFDGDGCISGSKQKQVKFISSTIFSNGLHEFLSQNSIKCCKVSSDKHHKKETGYFRICNSDSIKTLHREMYKNAPFFLKRKEERF